MTYNSINMNSYRHPVIITKQGSSTFEVGRTYELAEVNLYIIKNSQKDTKLKYQHNKEIYKNNSNSNYQHNRETGEYFIVNNLQLAQLQLQLQLELNNQFKSVDFSIYDNFDNLNINALKTILNYVVTYETKAHLLIPKSIGAEPFIVAYCNDDDLNNITTNCSNGNINKCQHCHNIDKKTFYYLNNIVKKIGYRIFDEKLVDIVKKNHLFKYIYQFFNDNFINNLKYVDVGTIGNNDDVDINKMINFVKSLSNSNGDNNNNNILCNFYNVILENCKDNLAIFLDSETILSLDNIIFDKIIKEFETYAKSDQMLYFLMSLPINKCIEGYQRKNLATVEKFMVQYIDTPINDIEIFKKLVAFVNKNILSYNLINDITVDASLVNDKLTIDDLLTCTSNLQLIDIIVTKYKIDITGKINMIFNMCGNQNNVNTIKILKKYLKQINRVDILFFKNSSFCELLFLNNYYEPEENFFFSNYCIDVLEPGLNTYTKEDINTILNNLNLIVTNINYRQQKETKFLEDSDTLMFKITLLKKLLNIITSIQNDLDKYILLTEYLQILCNDNFTINGHNAKHHNRYFTFLSEVRENITRHATVNGYNIFHHLAKDNKLHLISYLFINVYTGCLHFYKETEYFNTAEIEANFNSYPFTNNTDGKCFVDLIIIDRNTSMSYLNDILNYVPNQLIHKANIASKLRCRMNWYNDYSYVPSIVIARLIKRGIFPTSGNNNNYSYHVSYYDDDCKKLSGNDTQCQDIQLLEIEYSKRYGITLMKLGSQYNNDYDTIIGNINLSYQITKNKLFSYVYEFNKKTGINKITDGINKVENKVGMRKGSITKLVLGMSIGYFYIKYFVNKH